MVSHRVEGFSTCASSISGTLPLVNQAQLRQQGRASALWNGTVLTLPATTGRSPCTPSRGRNEQLNDKFPATSLVLSSAGPGQKLPVATGTFMASRFAALAPLVIRDSHPKVPASLDAVCDPARAP
jgi:hypothetical protein